MHSNGVCILTPKQASAFEMHGAVSDCRHHHHISRGLANEMVNDSVVVLTGGVRGMETVPVRLCDVRWISKGRMLVIERSRSWKRVPSGLGMPVMQLVPGGASW
jgi:succinylglutamate desuccinylase